jgi:aminoglycoside phosphotransferase (APT) family kinase protein
MTASPVTLRPEETESVLRAALCSVHGADARLQGWTAERFTTHGRHRVVRYDVRAHVAGAPGIQQYQWVGKFYDRDADARRAGTILRALARTDFRAGRRVVIPRLIAYDAPRRLLLMTYEAGDSVTSAIAQYGGVVLSAIGRTLAALHASDIALDGATLPSAVIGRLRPRVADLCARFPDHDASLRRMLVTLEHGTPVSPARPSFLHGDFGPAQLLWQTGRIVVLDFDTCTRGDPALDLGNLLTQLRRLTLRRPEKLPVAFGSLRAAILDAYQRWTPHDPGLDQRVSWYERTALLRKIHGLAFDRTRHPEADAIQRREAEAINLLTQERDSV